MKYSGLQYTHVSTQRARYTHALIDACTYLPPPSRMHIHIHVHIHTKIHTKIHTCIHTQSIFMLLNKWDFQMNITIWEQYVSYYNQPCWSSWKWWVILKSLIYVIFGQKVMHMNTMVFCYCMLFRWFVALTQLNYKRKFFK